MEPCRGVEAIAAGTRCMHVRLGNRTFCSHGVRLIVSEAGEPPVEFAIAALNPSGVVWVADRGPPGETPRCLRHRFGSDHALVFESAILAAEPAAEMSALPTTFCVVARAESDARGRLAALRVWLPGCKARALHFERPAPRFHATPPPDARRPVPLLIGL